VVHGIVGHLRRREVDGSAAQGRAAGRGREGPVVTGAVGDRDRSGAIWTRQGGKLLHHHLGQHGRAAVHAIAVVARNRMDSSATMLTQMVVEQLATLPRPDGTTTVTITDCAGNNWTLSAAAGGAPLSGTSINFSSAQVTNYSMNYVVCGANNTQATYDVRWNVQSLSPGFTSLVTVAARPRGATGDLRRFAIPVSVRVITGRS